MFTLVSRLLPLPKKQAIVDHDRWLVLGSSSETNQLKKEYQNHDPKTQFIVVENDQHYNLNLSSLKVYWGEKFWSGILVNAFRWIRNLSSSSIL